MLRRLALHTATNAIAFFIVSLVGLLVLPLLVDRVGLSGYGILVLARVFLPAGGLALFDLGLADAATIAIARTNGADAPSPGGNLSLLLALALGVGALTGMAIWVLSDVIVQVQNVEGADAVAFAQILRATALATPLLFVSLVFEGCLKGYEKFGAIRLADVLAALAWAGLVLFIPEAGVETLGIVYLATLAARSLAIAVAAAALMARNGDSLARPDRRAFDEVRQRSALMAVNRILGVAQSQLPPVLIGILLTPAAVGAFDVITRLPRFLKAVLGLLNSAVLPLSVRIDSSGDSKSLSRLGDVGLRVLALLVVPPLAITAAFANPILWHWLGPDFADRWPWLAIMTIVPLLSSLGGFGAAGLIARQEWLSSFNRLAIIQVVLQYLLALLLVGSLDERAFIVGIVVSMMAVFPLQYALIASGQRLPSSLGTRLAGAIAAGTLVVALSWVFAPAPDRLLTNILVAIALTAVLVPALLRICLAAQERSSLKAAVRRMLGRCA